MNAAFAARLVNGPFGDPGLYIHLRWEGRALLFDLGHNDALPAADMFRVSHVFVSHCHMDHFIGFDHLLRLFLARDEKLSLFGPPGIIDCVDGKLRGYTWNLVDNYQFAIEVSEVAPDSIRRVSYSRLGLGLLLKTSLRCRLPVLCLTNSHFGSVSRISIIGFTHSGLQ